MGLPVIYVLTHDSIALGEDGPTHQPVEHLSMIRSIPNTNVFRPCDYIETIESYEIALSQKQTPSVFALSRQNISFVRNVYEKKNLTLHGGYLIHKSDNIKNDHIRIISSGSEVALSCLVSKELTKHNIQSCVVSMPSLYLFDKQTDEYKKEILGSDCKSKNDRGAIRVFIEAANLMSYYKYYRSDMDILIQIETFGSSGKDIDVLDFFGYNVESITKKILNTMSVIL
jgi:transketolase